ncbi:uncharacterized membrane protein YhaH (DUF805 family) [Microbacterium testaceum]|uniref:DUF805 domain-containing protein n=1 Tax=Microbacterium TaxID=33882 RepID=UPI00278686FF|nr:MULTISPECIES: DUF805 domain-containing protein [Microbacterium]MDQ1113315.1 uncharacterized membrane protein YhaH (DUF805 family) [Microbacterium testaceum]MDR6099584.1 uncharacterized membrane protein YhaH (DUF805 family) [Microbacterium sp. SORGH_AS_0454]
MTAAAPPLDQPYYGAPLGAAVRRVFAKYATFRGRASRSEYWWWVLTAAVVGTVLNALPTLTDGIRIEADGSTTITGPLGVILGAIWLVWALATIVPTFAVLVRRLHDTGRSGFWVFIGVVPLIGVLVLFVFTLQGPRPEGARFDA